LHANRFAFSRFALLVQRCVNGYVRKSSLLSELSASRQAAAVFAVLDRENLLVRQVVAGIENGFAVNSPLFH